MLCGKKVLSGMFCVLGALALWADADRENPRAGDWAEDIDYLVGRLRAQHPDVTANVDPEVLLQSVEDLKGRLSRMTDQQILVAIHGWMARLGDVHTSPAPWQSRDPALLGHYLSYPLNFYSFSDGIFISSAAREHARVVGQRVVALGGLAAETVRDRVMLLLSADNASGRLAQSEVFMSVGSMLAWAGVEGATEHLELTLEDRTGERRVYPLRPLPYKQATGHLVAGMKGRAGTSVVRMNEGDASPPPLYLSRPELPYWCTWMAEGCLVYVCLKDFSPSVPGDFDRFWKEVLDLVDQHRDGKLVLDVRNNGGGDHFELPLLKGILARPWLDSPEKLFVIVGRQTVSAAQHFATVFSMYTRATFVGENSGGRPNHYGAQRFFNLPHSGLPCRTSVVFHQDQTEWEMADCTRPHFHTPLSSEDYRRHRDPALERIMTFGVVRDLPERFVRDLSQAYERGGLTAVNASCSRFLKIYGKTGVDTGLLLNGFSWWLSAHAGNPDAYTSWLKHCVGLCPDRTEFWHALARRFDVAGDDRQAEAYYLKALSVFPGNTLSRRNLALIRFERAFRERKKR